MNAEFEKLVDYCTHQMNDKEKVDFEQLMLTDADLVSQVAEMNQILGHVEQIGDADLRRRLKGIEHNLENEGFFISDEKIYNYLDGKCSEQEENLIEKRMAEDDEFAAHVENLTTIQGGINKKGDDDLRNMLSEITKKPAEPKEVSIFPTLFSFMSKVAAVLLLITGISVWYYSSKNLNTNNDNQIANNIDVEKRKDSLRDTVIKPTKKIPAPVEVEEQKIENGKVEEKIEPKKITNTTNYLALAESNYPNPNFSSFRSEENELDNLIKLYERKEFSSVLAAIKENKQLEEDWFFELKSMEGNALFNLKKFKAAESTFNEIVQTKTQPFAQEAQFYVLLCKIATIKNEKNEALQYANEIMKNKNHSFYKETQNIVILLNK